MARRIVQISYTGARFVFDDSWNDPDGRVQQLEYVLQPNSKVPEHLIPLRRNRLKFCLGLCMSG